MSLNNADCKNKKCEDGTGCSTSLFWPRVTRQMELENREPKVKQDMHNEKSLYLSHPVIQKC